MHHEEVAKIDGIDVAPAQQQQQQHKQSTQIVGSAQKPQTSDFNFNTNSANTHAALDAALEAAASTAAAAAAAAAAAVAVAKATTPNITQATTTSATETKHDVRSIMESAKLRQQEFRRLLEEHEQIVNEINRVETEISSSSCKTSG